MKNFAFYAKAQPSIGIAKIVFNYLLSNYTNERFGDVCETTSGGTPNRGNADFYNGDIPWLKSGELNDGLITSYEETITDLGLKNSSAKIFPKDTLLVAMYGATAGKTGILNFDAATNQAVCAVFPKEKVQRDFVFWYLKQQRVDFIEISRGGAQPNISQTVIKNAVIPCPSTEVQQTVVAFLNKVDAGSAYQIPHSLQAISREVDNLLLIRNRFEAANLELTSQTDYLTQLRQALLRQAMQGQLFPQDPTDEPAAVLLQQLQAAKAATSKKGRGQAGALFAGEAAEGPFEIPASWAWSQLKDVVANFGQKVPDKDFVYIDVSSIDNSRGVVSQDVIILKPEQAPSRARKIIQKGCVIYSTIRPYLLNIALIEDDFSYEGIASTAFAVMNPSAVVYNKYLYHYLRSPQFIRFVEEKQKGQAYPAINDENLYNGFIPLPPLAEQHRIVAKLEQLLGHCDALEQRIRESRRLAEQLLATALREALAPPAVATPPAAAELELAEATQASARRSSRRGTQLALGTLLD